MSSNINIKRICQYCSTEFTAHTTVTKYCSHKCSQRAYKDRKRAEKIEKSNIETKQKQKQPIELLKAKEFLNVNEVCELIGVSRRTIYRLVKSNQLNIIKIGSRTIIKRSALDEILNKSFTTLKPKEAKPITEFYTIDEVQQKFNIGTTWVYKIISEYKIPKTKIGGKTHVSKKHIDKPFIKQMESISNIKEWYSVTEAMEKYNLSRNFTELL